MKRKGFFFNFFLTIFVIVNAQKSDSINLKEVIFQEKLPTSQQKISQTQLTKTNFGKDIPFLLEHSLSILSTSDAGNGVGYTGFRIRGVDQSRINIALDGVPINDSESQQVFWVNMPDLASGLSNIIVQRGVGSSSNGIASFGASVALQTQNPDEKFSGNLSSSFGSFGTIKNNFSLNTGGIFPNLYAKAGINYLTSNGYIDRASSDLFSYYFKLSYLIGKSIFSLLNFSGREKTYQAWYGVDENTLRNNRTTNLAGAIYNSSYDIIDYYNNQTDNYSQNHYHFNWKYRINSTLDLKTTLYYTKGKGYYEEYKQDQNVKEYVSLSHDLFTDLIRKKWLDNDFLGISTLVNYNKQNHFLQFNLMSNQYVGYHFGKVTEIKNPSMVVYPFEYYRSLSTKTEFSSFLKWLYQYSQLEFFIDLQYRNVNYKSEVMQFSEKEGDVSFRKNFSFWNPKAGFNYNIKSGKIYASIAISHREPTRTDILENTVILPEKLYDLEIGFYKKIKTLSIHSNLYGMFYKNQLLLSGMLDDVGNPIKENSAKSYRIGWETELSYKISNKLLLKSQTTISSNINTEYFDVGKTQIAFSPNYIQSLVLEYIISNNFSIQLFHKYISEQYMSNKNEENSKLNSYLQSDLFISYSLEKTLNKPITLQLALYNVINENIINNGYYYDNIPYYYPQAFRNYLIKISWNF